MRGKYPYLSRDTGADILEMVQKKNIPFLRNQINFAQEGLYCEFCYVLDFDKDKLEIYVGFGIQPGNKKGRFYSERPTDEMGCYPVDLIKTYKFSKLNKTTMKELEKKHKT